MVRVAAAVLGLALLSPGEPLSAQSPPATQTSYVYVTGEVKNPGRYPHVPKMTVLELIAQSGGLLPSADLRLVLISGTEKDRQGKPVTSFINYVELLQGKNLATNSKELQPGDQLIARGKR